MDHEYHDASSTDEYFMTAVQIFDYCGGDSSGTLRVDSLMDKFAPFVKTNKGEFSYLKSLLDPDHSNPEINVAKLARALNQYSDNQKAKVDLEESFNLKSGPMPQDSDSGISTDGFQLLEELQSELREKAHLTHQLRSQLDFTDRQHEEVVATLTAERDSLRAHLNMLRDENITLTHVKRDYEEACDRLCASEQALETTRRELETTKKRARAMDDHIQVLETEKLNLQELLAKSKAECHRINEMYASRQSALLEENETLRAEHADSTAKLQDHDEFVQQLIREKVLLEMELKDVLNRANQTQLRLDRSIDVSYTDDQMLSALDTLTAESRFVQEQHLLDEEAFTNALREEQGRMTNFSLYDEIRLSVSNTSRLDLNDLQNTIEGTVSEMCNKLLENSVTVETQTDKSFANCPHCSKKVTEFVEIPLNDVVTQRDEDDMPQRCQRICACVVTCDKTKDAKSMAIRTECNEKEGILGNIEEAKYSADAKYSMDIIDAKELENFADAEKSDSCEDFKDSEDSAGVGMSKSLADLKEPELFTDAEESENLAHPKESKNLECPKEPENQAESKDLEHYVEPHCEISTQQPGNINMINCNVCFVCEKRKSYTEKLETDLKNSQSTMVDLQESLETYEQNLDLLQNLLDEGSDRNSMLQVVVESLQSKLQILEAACAHQKDILDSVSRISVNDDTSCVHCQTESDQSSVATQVEVPCNECEKRSVEPHRGLRKYFWEPLKSLFQVFAVICFLCAVSALYGVGRRWRANCREPVPWGWLNAQEFMDMLLRIEYIAEVPM